MPEPKKRGGRPRREPKPGERVPLSLRVTPETKKRLDDAAIKSGRSQSQEAEIRLEQSFQREDLLGDALKLAFGRELAGLVLLLGRAMHMAGTRAHWSFVRPMHPYEGVPEDWPHDPRSYDQAVRAVTAIMEAARPAGDPDLPALDENDPRLTEAGKKQVAKLNEVQRQMGDEAARIMVDMVKRSRRGSNAWEQEVETIRKLLGPMADRLTAQPYYEEGDDNG